MLTIKYRNANITFDNHTNLLLNQNDLNKLFERLDVLFDKAKFRYDKGLIQSDAIIFIRLRQTQNLSIYIGVGKSDNPYLFLYDAKTKNISKDIPYVLFKMLENDIIIGDLEDKLNNIGNPKYNNLLPNNIYEMIENEFDDLE